MKRARQIAGLSALAGGLAAATGLILTLPAEDTPWARLTLDDPIGAFTDLKLDALARNPEACFATLAESELWYSRMTPRSSGAFCGYDDGVELVRSVTPYSAPVVVRCPVAAALYLWERDVLQPAAQEIYGQKITQIRHYGTYACRRVYGRPNGPISEHASANAIDVAGFRLEDGREVSLYGGWDGDPQDAAFLRAARDGACRVFQGVISPDHNAAHADHFHLDMGPHDFCR